MTEPDRQEGCEQKQAINWSLGSPGGAPGVPRSENPTTAIGLPPVRRLRSSNAASTALTHCSHVEPGIRGPSPSCPGKTKASTMIPAPMRAEINGVSSYGPPPSPWMTRQAGGEFGAGSAEVPWDRGRTKDDGRLKSARKSDRFAGNVGHWVIHLFGFHPWVRVTLINLLQSSVGSATIQCVAVVVATLALLWRGTLIMTGLIASQVWLIVACLGLQIPNEARPDILIASFEGTTYGDGWQASGTAFGAGPARGTFPGQMSVEGYEGQGLVSSFAGGDDTEGTLISPPFLVERRYLNFLIGGGKWPAQTCVDLVVAGRAVRTATGPNDAPGGSERLAWSTWDLGDLAGADRDPPSCRPPQRGVGTHQPRSNHPVPTPAVKLPRPPCPSRGRRRTTCTSFTCICRLTLRPPSAGSSWPPGRARCFATSTSGWPKARASS